MFGLHHVGLDPKKISDRAFRHINAFVLLYNILYQAVIHLY